MHKQDNTTTDKGLEAIMESMYTEKTIPCDKCNGEGCEHCNGTGTHAVKEDEDTGRIPHDVDSFGTKKKEYDPTKSKWYKDDPENDANIARDKHSQNLQTIKPLDELAAKHGADDIIDWLAQQVKQPGSNFVGWFEDIMNEI